MGLGDKKRWRGLDKSLMALILRNNSFVYMKYVVDVSSMFDVLYIIVYGLLWLFFLFFLMFWDIYLQVIVLIVKSITENIQINHCYG